MKYDFIQQGLLASVSQFFNYSQQVGDAINNTLSTLGIHAGVSRVYIFEDIEGKFFKLEKVLECTLTTKVTILKTLQFLSDKGLKSIQTYMKNKDGDESE